MKHKPRAEQVELRFGAIVFKRRGTRFSVEVVHYNPSDESMIPRSGYVTWQDEALFFAISCKVQRREWGGTEVEHFFREVSVGRCDSAKIERLLEENYPFFGDSFLRMPFAFLEPQYLEMSDAPPMGAVFLMLCLLWGQNKDPLDEIIEEYWEIRRDEGVPRARRWFWVQAVGSIGPLLKSAGEKLAYRLRLKK